MVSTHHFSRNPGSRAGEECADGVPICFNGGEGWARTQLQKDFSPSTSFLFFNYFLMKISEVLNTWPVLSFEGILCQIFTSPTLGGL